VRNAYIKFPTKEDRALGFHELVTHSHISRLSNDIFCIPWGSLALLDARQVDYSFANEDDLANAQPIWNFADSKKR
jgi:hypothetical protein